MSRRSLFDLVKGTIKKYLLKRQYFFLITTHGNTASVWLASAFNQYPDVFCTHGYDYPFPKNGIEPAEITAEQQNKRNEMTQKRFWRLTLHEFLYEIQRVTKKPVVGNVHAYTFGGLLRLLPGLQRKHRQNLIILNMVRHPVTRVNSMYKMFVSPDGLRVADFVESDFANRCHHFHDYLAKKYQLEYTPKAKAFLVALLALEDITRDVVLANQYGYQNIVFERVTTDSRYFTEILKRIVDPYEALNADVAESVFKATPKVNQHNVGGNASAEEQYRTWESWQQDAYRYVVNLMRMDNVYAEFDYQLIFD